MYPLICTTCTCRWLLSNYESSCRKMAVLNIIVVCVWLYLSVHCQAGEYPQVTFMGNDLANHSYLDLSLVGTSDNDSVQCHTNASKCCSAGNGLDRGDWTFPNGTRLLSKSYIDGNSDGYIYQKRYHQTVGLYRKSWSESGIYRCNITRIINKTMGFDKIHRFIYIGLYQSGGGYFTAKRYCVT